jgi:hypothetical protein
MANDVFINIKDLPEVTQLNSGDYILIETSTGTHILDFANLIIPRPNTVITTTVDENATALMSLLDSYNSSVILLSGSIETNSKDILALSSLVVTAIEDAATPAPVVNNNGVYIGTTQITIADGNKSASNILSPMPTIDLNTTDVIITPANAYAAKYNAYATSILNGNVTIQGFFYSLGTTVNQLSVASPINEVEISATGDAIYNIMVVKSF